MGKYTPEEAAKIRAEAVARWQKEPIRERFAGVTAPQNTWVLKANHICGHIVSYKGPSLALILDYTLEHIEGVRCEYCDLSAMGTTLEGVWR